MGKNLVRETISVNSNWTCPGGVTKIRVLAFGTLFPQVSGGPDSYGIGIDGTLFSWGGILPGSLGNLGLARSSPVLIGGNQWAMISGSSGVTVQGNAFAWGENPNGQMGNNTVTDSSIPVLISGGLTWKQVTQGNSATRLGITIDGTLYGWGLNTDGAVGDGTVVARSTPVAVLGGFSWLAVAPTNGDRSQRASCFGIATDNTLKAWGRNNFGQLGTGDVIPRSSPVAVLGSLACTAVAAGNGHCAVITTTGDMYAFGDNTKGQLGVGDVVSRSSPVLVVGSKKWRRVAAAGRLTVGITTDGDMYAWGENNTGALGDGTVVAKSSPVAVLRSFKWSDAGAGQLPSSLGGPNAWVLGLRVTGDLYGWGTNSNGELGLGDVAARSSPVIVVGSVLWRSVKTALLAERIIDVIPGSVYPAITIGSVSAFGYASIYTDDVGTMPTHFILEYEA